ncbi:glycosyltransferase family 2 protein [Oceanicoccus sagamiensis]|uniref:Glycosyl transferase n=1 Tax=Oceanicoccus sagamiensis TaxID=716816 RepID=A0A1X9N4F1_9GAMM|nr:glycosyltransferase family 2 protein [Oceanicoccus sagamiensis]ARN73028.1 glycosyl transferase [Oceanicoccus sagamiensis]
MTNFSIVIPAKNESGGLLGLLPELFEQVSVLEVIVVDDGSSDNTAEVAESFGAKVISHNYSKGNGAAIKAGARAARGDAIIFMDGDGQHSPDDVNRLIEAYGEGYDMVVGARGKSSQASHSRWLGNGAYNFISSLMVGHKIDDLTSGLRVVNAKKFKGFIFMLPNGFSYPTTITMAFFRAGYSVKYIPIIASERIGNSHLHVFKDGVRFFIIIFKVATLYSPLKIFFPVSSMLFFTSLSYYLFTYITDNRLTNMTVILFVISVVVFMIGLVSEQITTLLYQNSNQED